MNSIQLRFRVFSVNYMPATNTRPSRVKIRDERRGKTKVIPYDYGDSDLEMTARKYLNGLGIDCQAMGMMKDEFLLLSENFDIELV